MGVVKKSKYTGHRTTVYGHKEALNWLINEASWSRMQVRITLGLDVSDNALLDNEHRSELVMMPLCLIESFINYQDITKAIESLVKLLNDLNLYEYEIQKN